MKKFEDNIESYFLNTYHEANNIAITNQNKYFGFFKWSLLLLIFSLSMITLGAFIEQEYLKIILNILIVLFIISSLILSYIVFSSNLQKNWYEGRAVAESLKTLQWKFIMQASPYDQSQFIATEKLNENIQDIIRGPAKISIKFKHELKLNPQLEEIRNLTLEEKRKYYIEQRIQSQMHWYQQKSNTNKIREKRWLISVMIIFLFTLLSAIGTFFNSNHAVNFTALFATVATSIFSWMQSKKFQELSDSYGITANELVYINEKSKTIQLGDFQQFVNDTETAISREHTLWLARRDADIYLNLKK